jgi:hypothetical protein
MKREKLTELLRAAAETAGYAFYSGPQHRMNGRIRNYPAAWLRLPELKSQSGRKEGEITYRTTLHLLALPSSVEKEEVWNRLESDALTIAGIIAAADAVCRVDNISCTPAECSLTAHGECSATLVCDVTLWYCN